jgi:hypothetical protein
MVLEKAMKSMKLRIVALGLTSIPFIFAGWVFASWLATSALAADERGTLVVVDPPQEFYSIANRLGFKVMDEIALKDLDMITVTIRIPKGHYPHSAALLLRNSIPELVVDGSTLKINP